MAHPYFPLDACGVPFVSMQTTEEHASRARERIRAGEWSFAVHHIAGTLANDPAGNEARALITEALAAASDVDVLLPHTNNASHAVVATRALMLAQRGRYGEAIESALDAAAARPDLPYLTWVDQWIDAPDAMGKLASPQLADYAGHWVFSFDGDTDEGRTALDAGIPVLERLTRALPNDSDLEYWRIAAMRKRGRFEEALAAAEALYARDPRWRTALAVAMIHRARGDVDAAVMMFEKAIEHDPNDLGCRLDAGDLLCNVGRYDEGIAMYDAVLALSPGHEWAEPSALYYRYVRAGDPALAQQLLQYARAHRKNARARHLVDGLPPEVRASSKSKTKATPAKKAVSSSKKPATAARKGAASKKRPR